MDSIFLLSIILLGNIQSGVAVYVLFTSCGKSVNVGESCTLTCNTGTTTDSAIIWLNGTSSTAIDSNDCTNKGGLPDNYTSSCPSPGVFELTITGAQYGRDSHAWSCSNFFGGTPSNTTNNNTFVSVPLRLPNVTEAKQTIECYVITSPPATLKLFDVTTEIETETNYTRTWDGLKTTLSAEINGSGSYFCCADNGNEKRCSNFTISDEVTTPPPQPTTPPPPAINSSFMDPTITSTSPMKWKCSLVVTHNHCLGHSSQNTIWMLVRARVKIELSPRLTQMSPCHGKMILFKQLWFLLFEFCFIKVVFVYGLFHKFV